MEKKFFNIVLIIIIIFSLFNIFIIISRFNNHMTGAWGQGSGTRAATNITITEYLLINFTDNNVDFGSGYVNRSYQACVIGTDGTYSNGCVKFNKTNGLMLENQGTIDAKINISNSNYSSSMLNNLSGYAWQWSTPEDDNSTCTGGNLGYIKNNWTNITSVYNSGTASLCDFFNSSDASDTINLSFKFHIDKSVVARTIYDYWIVQAVSV